MKYEVWTDSESEVYAETREFDNLDSAYNYISKVVHYYDDKSLIIMHIDDLDSGETIDTVESLIAGVNC